MKKCPRCKELTLKNVPPRNALSRRDNKTMICSHCGTQEAFEDSKLIPHWLDDPENMTYWDTDSPVWHAQMERQHDKESGVSLLKRQAE